MSLTVDSEIFVPPVGASVVEVGDWLARCQWALDRVQAGWLQALAGWDLAQGWAADGQLSAVDWLVWRAGMARGTAFEKLRVAHQLRRRRGLAAAFAAGRVSYSAVRAITRAEGADPDVDEALVVLAEAGTVADVERAVRAWQLHADQHRPLPPPRQRRGLRLVPGYDGTTRLEAVLTDLEAGELEAALRAHLRDPQPVEESSAGDRMPDAAGGPVEESSAGNAPGDGQASRDQGPQATWPQRRADALVDLARSALGPAAPGGDRYLVHVVMREGGTAELLGGQPLDAGTTARITCDASAVLHLQGGGGEPLALGRRVRAWSSAQRRAIAVRDGGRCRWPGCPFTTTGIHHLRAWSVGGCTDVANGLLVCPRHHDLLHDGWTTTGAPDAALTFHRPDVDRTPIGTTVPSR